MNKLSLTLASILSISFFFAVTPTFASTTDLIARYHLNENTNNTTQDSSGNGFTGLAQNVNVVSGKYGNAFDFGNESFVEVPQDSRLEPTTVSVEAWVKALKSPGTFQYILSKGANGCNASSYALYTGANGGLQFYISDGTQFALSPDAGQGVWDGKWHYVTGSFDGTIVRLYIDGQQVSSGTPTALSIGYNLANGNDMFLGAYSGTCTFGFNGQVDEVRIWDRALSPTEIAQHFDTNSIWTSSN